MSKISDSRSKSLSSAQLAKEAAVSLRMHFQRVFETPLGWFAFQGTDRGITALTFGHSTREDALDRIQFESAWRFPVSNYDLSSSDMMTGAGEGIPNSSHPEPGWLAEAESLLTAYAAGEPVDLTTIPCDIPAKTRFEERVREQLAHVGYGRTITYGELAEAAGAPRAARAVGSVMARNPIPLVIACHRVLASNGKLGGYSAPSGLAMKERLLQLERTGQPQKIR